MRRNVMQMKPTHHEPRLLVARLSLSSSITAWSKYIWFLYSWNEMVVISRSAPPSSLSLGVPLAVSSLLLALGLAVVAYLRPPVAEPVAAAAVPVAVVAEAGAQTGSSRKKTVRFVN